MGGWGELAAAAGERGAVRAADTAGKAAANTVARATEMPILKFNPGHSKFGINTTASAIPEFPESGLGVEMTKNHIPEFPESGLGVESTTANTDKPGWMAKAKNWTKDQTNSAVAWAKDNPGKAWTAGGVTLGALWLYGNHLDNQDAQQAALQGGQGQYS